jgi:hypothetical protein
VIVVKAFAIVAVTVLIVYAGIAFTLGYNVFIEGWWE